MTPLFNIRNVFNPTFTPLSSLQDYASGGQTQPVTAGSAPGPTGNTNPEPPPIPQPQLPAPPPTSIAPPEAVATSTPADTTPSSISAFSPSTTPISSQLRPSTNIVNPLSKSSPDGAAIVAAQPQSSSESPAESVSGVLCRLKLSPLNIAAPAFPGHQQRQKFICVCVRALDYSLG